MRLLCFALCAFSLLTQLSAQNDPISLGLKLEVGSTYLLELQKQERFVKSAKQLAAEQQNFRKEASFQQRSKRYQLKVLAENDDDSYQVELVRTLVQSYIEYDQFAMRIWDRDFDQSSPSYARDTVRFTMDQYAQVSDLVMPDSIAIGYATPDDYQVKMEKVMSELLSEFTALFDFLRPQPTLIGEQWQHSSGKTFTFTGQHTGLWSIHASDGRQIYLDPQSKWVQFMEQHQRLADNTAVRQLVKGQTDKGAQLIRISGTAPEHTNGSFLIRVTPYSKGYDAEYLIEVDADGDFSWQMPFTEPCYFQLTDQYNYNFWGYAAPGSELKLQFENRQYRVEGATEEECRYLNTFAKHFPKYEYFLQFGGENQSSSILFEQQLEQAWTDYLQDRDSAKQQLIAWNSLLAPDFVSAQKRQIDYLWACALNMNLSLHYIFRARAGNTTESIPDHFLDELNEQTLYYDLDRSLPAFRALLHLNLQRKLFESTSGDIINIISRPYESSYYFAQLQYKNYPLYQITHDLVRSAILRASRPANIRHLYQHFLDTQAPGDSNLLLTQTFDQMTELQTAGQAVPKFKAFNQLGQSVQLQDLEDRPVVLVLEEGKTYWRQILIMEDTPKLLPDVQFVFLQVGKSGEDALPIPAYENVHQWFAREHSAAVAQAFLQYNKSKHPRAYLIDRQGNIADVLEGHERYDDGILAALHKLQAGKPIFDQQTQKGILLLLIGLLAGGLTIGLGIHQWQKRLRRREFAKRQQVESQLQVIRSQLNPHFMFNSMSSIQYLIKSGQPLQAESYLGKLAQLLRASLHFTREQFISLQEELDMIRKYCELESLRFNFSYDLQVEGTLDLQSISIPPLLLQPYIENAVHHGIAPLRNRGKLIVNISEQSHLLWIRIRDNGQGLKASRPGSHRGNGIGLQLNAERLKLIYGKEAQVNIYSPSPFNNTELHGGTEVQIAMPIDV